MIGPVFILEWQLASARGKHHRWRAGYVALLSLELIFIFVALILRGVTQSPLVERPLASVFFQFLLGQHVLFAVFAPPVLAAGSIVDEKTRGTLMTLLTTPLSSLGIVCGKWLAQLSILALLLLPAAPLLVCLGLFGGWPLAALLIVAAYSLLFAIIHAGIAVLFAVWCRKTWSAVVVSYAMFFSLIPTASLLSQAFGGASRLPGIWDLVDQPELLAITLSCLLFGCGGAAILCLSIAAWRLRPAYQKQLSARAKRRWWQRWRARPPVSERQPLRWKERFAGELGNLAFLRAMPHQYRKIGAFVLTAFFSFVFVALSEELFLFQSVAFLLIVSLTVAARASSVICGERERQTWETLLSTPLTPYQIVRGKLWGIIDSARPYLMGYLAPALVAALFVGPSAVVWTLFWWLATWIVLYFLGAVGIRASVGSSGSWQGLLKTFAGAGWLLLQRWFLLFIPFAFCVNWLNFFFFATFRNQMWSMLLTTIAPTAFLLAVLFAKTEEILQQAERQIDEERIPDNMLMAIKEFGASGVTSQ